MTYIRSSRFDFLLRNCSWFPKSVENVAFNKYGHNISKGNEFMIIGLCFDIGGTLVNSGPGFCEQVISIVGTSRPNLKALLQRHFLCSSVSRTLAIRHFCEALKVDSPSTLETEIRKIKKRNLTYSTTFCQPFRNLIVIVWQC